MKKYLVSVLFVAVLALGFSACKRNRSICGKKRIDSGHKTSKVIPQRVEPREVFVQKTEPKYEVKTRDEEYGSLRDSELARELEELEAGLGKEF